MTEKDILDAVKKTGKSRSWAIRTLERQEKKTYSDKQGATK